MINSIKINIFSNKTKKPPEGGFVKFNLNIIVHPTTI